MTEVGHVATGIKEENDATATTSDGPAAVQLPAYNVMQRTQAVLQIVQDIPGGRHDDDAQDLLNTCLPLLAELGDIVKRYENSTDPDELLSASLFLPLSRLFCSPRIPMTTMKQPSPPPQCHRCEAGDRLILFAERRMRSFPSTPSSASIRSEARTQKEEPSRSQVRASLQFSLNFELPWDT